MNRLGRSKNINQSDSKTNRLFGLFALNRQNRLTSTRSELPRIGDANNQSLQLDWDEFCYDIFNETPDHPISLTWQRLSQQVLRLHRSRSRTAQASMPSPSKQPVFDTVRIDSKFERSFNVAMHLTARALRIKGVSDDNIARTQSTLKEKRSQQTKNRQLARAQTTQEVNSYTGRLSVKHPDDHFDSLSAPVILSPLVRSVSQDRQLARAWAMREVNSCNGRPAVKRHHLDSLSAPRINSPLVRSGSLPSSVRYQR